MKTQVIAHKVSATALETMRAAKRRAISDSDARSYPAEIAKIAKPLMAKHALTAAYARLK